MLKGDITFSDVNPDKLLAEAVKVLQRDADKAWAQTETGMLEALRATPKRRSYPSEYPLEWTSDRQRKAYFASNGFGAGIPYQRTGSMARGWETTRTATPLGVRYTVLNTQDKARFVYGALRGELANALRFKQNFHTVTGWQSARPIVDKAFKGFVTLFKKTAPKAFRKARVSRA